MLSTNNRTRIKRNNRYYERVRLRLKAQNEPIPPYKYNRPPELPLGITVPDPTDYDISRSTINLDPPITRNSSSSEVNETTSSDDSSNISVHTIKLYNRLEGRWETAEPSALHHQQRHAQWLVAEENRRSTEPHPDHSNTNRLSYVEYHRLQVYNNDTDSSYNTSSIYESSTSNTTFSYETTDSNNTFTSECTSITWDGRTRRYYPDHYYNEGERMEIEYDSDGDFPFPYSSTSTSTSSHRSTSRSTEYATQEDPRYDDRLDPVTGRHNEQYWQRINETSISLTGRPLPYVRRAPLNYLPLLPVQVPAAPELPARHITSTTTRITTTETDTRSLNPLPTLGYRRHLPFPAARKSTSTSNKAPSSSNPGRRHLSATKQTARKSTTVAHRVPSPTPPPDTTSPDVENSDVDDRKPAPSRKRAKHSQSSSDASVDSTASYPCDPRYKYDSNEDAFKYESDYDYMI
jgi:hypothetical protein